MGLPGFPHTKRGINQRAIRKIWTFRKRARNGGGREYLFDFLPEKMRIAIIKKNPGLFCIAAGSGSTPPDACIHSQDSSHESLWTSYAKRSGKQKSVAEKRLKAVDRVLDLEGGGFKKMEAVMIVSEEIGSSPSTIFNWLRMIEGLSSHDWLPALVGRWGGSAVGKKFPNEIWAIFKADYLRKEAPAAAACYNRLKRIFEKENRTIPSLRTLMRRLRHEIPRGAIILARQGEKALDRMYPSQERDKSDLHALECVNADGHKFDVFVKWPDGITARPVGIFIQDIYSGKILSYRIDRSENRDLIRLAFADLAEKFGIPLDIFLDNSRAFASKWLTGGVKNRYRFKIKSEEPTGILKSLGCKIHWTRPYRGQSKPIERAFRDLSEYVSKHPRFSGAYTGRNTSAKPENYGTRAVDLDVFLKVLDEEIKVHNAREGRKSAVCNGGRSFDSVFIESYERGPIRKATEGQRGLLLLAAEQAKVSRYDGSIVLAGGNRYWNERLSQYGGQKLIVRLDPQNLHAGVFVYDLKNSFICFAKCIQPTGFKDARAAREHARLGRRSIKAHKAILENERRMDALQVAERLSEMQVPEAQVQEARSTKVIQGLFEKKVKMEGREKNKFDKKFEEIMEKIKDSELREIALKYPAHPECLESASGE